MFVRGASVICEHGLCLFSLGLLLGGTTRYGFPNTDSALLSWPKSHFVLVCCFCNVVLGSPCLYFM